MKFGQKKKREGIHHHEDRKIHVIEDAFWIEKHPGIFVESKYIDIILPAYFSSNGLLYNGTALDLIKQEILNIILINGAPCIHLFLILSIS